MRRKTSKKLDTDYGIKADLLARKMSRAIKRDLRIKRSLSPDASSYVAECQGNDFLKKFKFLEDDSNLDIKAYQKFLHINRRLKKVSFSFPSVNRLSRSNSKLENILLLAKRYIKLILGDVHWEEVFLHTRHSAGASMGVNYSDTSLEAKFSYPMTTTEKAKRVFERYLSFDHRLKEAIIEHNRHTNGPRYSSVTASRATTVPKTNKIDRMIAIEPTVNMFLQQGLMNIMYSRLKFWGLDVATLPEKHKALAFESSITGLKSTIDFSSASDCVSIRLMEYLLPPSWLSCLTTVRSTHMTVGSNDVELSMISTMGNATTFPIETVVFYALGIACEHYMYSSETGYSGIPWPDKFKNTCSVFGDDCIVSTAVSDLFIEVCTGVGFLVNKEKSFTEDTGFRESCGGDYLRGRSVRPFCLKRPTSRKKSSYLPWLYNIYNQLNTKYRMYFGVDWYVYDKAAFAILFSEMKKESKHLFAVPSYFPSDSGLWLDDLNRVATIYNLSIYRQKVDEHGSVLFNYFRFNYQTTKDVNDHLRYYVELKKLRSKSEAHAPVFSLRRDGGYVVAKSRTPFWT